MDLLGTCVFGGGASCHGAHVVVIGHLVGVGSFPLLCPSGELNSGLQVWQQAPLPAAPSRQPPVALPYRSLPVVSVSPVLDCGHCLIGGVKVTKFICKNVGFSVGKFCIMAQKSWPPPSFRVSGPGLRPGKRANPPKQPSLEVTEPHLGQETRK